MSSRNRMTWLRAALVALTLTLSLSAIAGNPSRGQQLATEVCQGCHGMDGNLAIADGYPLIGGQHEDYLVVALKAYRSGARDNAVMASFAQGLSDQDIEDVAAWYAGQDGLHDLDWP